MSYNMMEEEQNLYLLSNMLYSISKVNKHHLYTISLEPVLIL